MTIMAAEAFLSSLLVKDHPQYTEWGIATVEVMREFLTGSPGPRAPPMKTRIMSWARRWVSQLPLRRK